MIMCSVVVPGRESYKSSKRLGYNRMQFHKLGVTPKVTPIALSLAPVYQGRESYHPALRHQHDEDRQSGTAKTRTVRSSRDFYSSALPFRSQLCVAIECLAGSTINPSHALRRPAWSQATRQVTYCRITGYILLSPGALRSGCVSTPGILIFKWVANKPSWSSA